MTNLLSLCIVLVCLVSQCQSGTTSDAPTSSAGYSNSDSEDSNETKVTKVLPVTEGPTYDFFGDEDDNTTTTTTTTVSTKVAVENVEAVDSEVNTNRTMEGLDTNGVLNVTDIEEPDTGLNATEAIVKAREANAKPEFIDEILLESTTAGIAASDNETYAEKVKGLMRRLFKRQAIESRKDESMKEMDHRGPKGDGIVGSLVARDTDEIAENEKITVPMVCQVEYYHLKQRKQEIERNKLMFANKENKSEHEDLIQETWEKLVNWSQDHIAFEKKVIRMHKLKQHDNLMRTKEIDSDDEPDSDDELISKDEDEDSDKSLPPEFATVKNLAEVNEKYLLEKDIEDIESRMRRNPKQEDNEKNRLLLKQYRTDLKMIQMKYDRIRDMKLNREFVEELWREKNMIKKKKGEKDSDDDEK